MTTASATQRLQDRQALSDQLRKRYQDFKANSLQLDLTRGKPSAAQLDLSDSLLTNLGVGDINSSWGDCRNYGAAAGLPEARAFFGDYLGMPAEQTLVGGNSSLNLMHDVMRDAFVRGTATSERPWSQEPTVRFLCPVPGYDRHFSVCEYFGFELVPVPMRETGPDMDAVEAIVGDDPAVKGIWCVPKYSNPTGIIFSDSTVERLGKMPTAAKDFRVFWDNAYAVHDFDDPAAQLASIADACDAAGYPNRPLQFGSTSKITFAGAGVAAMAAGPEEFQHLLQGIGTQTIGPDKLNQLRHLRFFGDLDGLRRHMRGHAEILREKFDRVQRVLARELDGLDIAHWSRPRGGYFVSVDVEAGSARRVAELAADVGVTLTAAGATFPGGVDPDDRNLRLAPSFPLPDEVEQATEVLAVCIQLAALEASD